MDYVFLILLLDIPIEHDFIVCPSHLIPPATLC